MDTLTQMTQLLFARLFSQISTRASRQKGASALEYIVLAAVIVAALILVGTFLAGNSGFSGFFSDLFGKASSALNP
ncbi:Flp/Fap pilin component [Alcanivorax hongdengensis A-11-3]|uniref:Flp/Fap pilin component n=1 Tax=Alcanivorax hongdengensis A-11-3 TaxID=1177179 RepID=L0WEW3_9GAMM|nr:hypothetical protein [Alcanivorax hongdengensis]EKF74345.1 Flp/Fap pilin component [Alcanivorax hongdengensis A-11-3]